MSKENKNKEVKGTGMSETEYRKKLEYSVNRIKYYMDKTLKLATRSRKFKIDDEEKSRITGFVANACDEFIEKMTGAEQGNVEFKLIK